MGWSVEPVGELRGYTVEWLEPGLALLSRANRIYRAATPTGERDLVGEIPAPLWKRALAGLRLGQRFLRFLVYNVLPLPDDSLFVTFGRQVGIVSAGGYRELEGIRRPSRVLRRGCALAPDGSVIWGEYIGNRERGGITVYRYRPETGRVEERLRFPAGEVRHVHGVYADPFSNEIWCLTGDLADECRVLRSRDGLGSLETVGQGDETWRAVSLLFRPDAVYYGSDAEFQDNHLYRIDRRSGERDRLAAVDGPVYYSQAVGDDLFFATTAELCPGQREPTADLWHVEPGGQAARIRSFRKDLFGLRLTADAFMYGTLHFPAGPGLERETYIAGVGLRGVDNRTLRLYRPRAAP